MVTPVMLSWMMLFLITVPGAGPVDLNARCRGPDRLLHSKAIDAHIVRRDNQRAVAGLEQHFRARPPGLVLGSTPALSASTVVLARSIVACVVYVPVTT